MVSKTQVTGYRGKRVHFTIYEHLTLNIEHVAMNIKQKTSFLYQLLAMNCELSAIHYTPFTISFTAAKTCSGIISFMHCLVGHFFNRQGLQGRFDRMTVWPAP